jgi:diaminopimelate epimerase
VQLELVKYHGLGNDFLVLAVRDAGVRGAGHPADACGGMAPIADGSLARALCDRHYGIGADGLLVVRALGPGRVAMELFNADGGVAETSGNGLRCAALAAVEEHLVDGPEMDVETLAGTVHAAVAPGPDPGGADVRVEMGIVEVGPELGLDELPEPDPSRWPDLRGGTGAGSWGSVLASLAGRRARRVAVGNPHLVLYADPGARSAPTPPGHGVVARIDEVGPALEAGVEGGVNVELVEVQAQDASLGLEVWERGVGVTLACGSGSCAAAAAARAAGLVGDVVEVANPGGTLVVELSGDPVAASAVLAGPARRVGRILLDSDELFRAAPGPSPESPSGSPSPHPQGRP